MKIQHLLFVGFAGARPLHGSIKIAERDLIGLIGGNLIIPPPTEPTIPPGVSNLLSTWTVLPTTADRPRATSTTGTRSTVATTAISALVTTNQVVNTALLVQTTTPDSQPNYSYNTSSSNEPGTTGWVGDVSATPPAELNEWKVIGIGVITVTLIGIIILSISFFDAWWGFLRSVLFGRKANPEGEETMVPDCKRSSWEFRIATEDGHRYPTMASLDSIAKEKERSH